MESFNCIAVDMGAASIRIMMGKIEYSTIYYEEVSRFKNKSKFVNGHERWDVEYFINEINKALKLILSLKDVKISSIGIDSWGVDFVLLDKNNDLLDIPVAYRDTRTNNMQQKWQSIMSMEETFLKTGINFYPFNTLFHLLSIRDEEYIKNISSVLFMPCYISYRLSGRIFNELTIASTSQLLNVKGKEMNIEILEHLNLNSYQFKKILVPGEIAGNIKVGYSLPSTVKMVAVCCHDTASAVFSIPSEDIRYAFISAGTWCILGILSDTPVLNSFALKNGFTNERGYGNSYRILKNIVGLWLIQGLQKSFDNRYSYPEIEELAGKTKCQSIIIPDEEVFYNPGNMKDAFDRFLTRTSQEIPKTPGQYFKIAYNSLCCSFRDNLNKLEVMMNTKIKRVHLIGGGCQSKYLCQQTANITRRKVIAGPVEGSTIGNIMVQGIALKVIKSVKEGKQMVMNSFDIKEYIPEGLDNKAENIYKIYTKLNQNK